MIKLIAAGFIVLALSGCGSGGNEKPAVQVNTAKPSPIIKIVENSILNGGTGHRDGRELVGVSYRIENTDYSQILRNLSCSLYDSHNSLVDTNIVTYDFLQSGSTWVTAGCSNFIFKSSSYGTFRIETFAMNADGVKSNVATATVTFQ